MYYDKNTSTTYLNYSSVWRLIACVWMNTVLLCLPLIFEYGAVLSTWQGVGVCAAGFIASLVLHTIALGMVTFTHETCLMALYHNTLKSTLLYILVPNYIRYCLTSSMVFTLVIVPINVTIDVLVVAYIAVIIIAPIVPGIISRNKFLDKDNVIH